MSPDLGSLPSDRSCGSFSCSCIPAGHDDPCARICHDPCCLRPCIQHIELGAATWSCPVLQNPVLHLQSFCLVYKSTALWQNPSCCGLFSLQLMTGFERHHRFPEASHMLLSGAACSYILSGPQIAPNGPDACLTGTCATAADLLEAGGNSQITALQHGLLICCCSACLPHVTPVSTPFLEIACRPSCVGSARSSILPDLAIAVQHLPWAQTARQDLVLRRPSLQKHLGSSQCRLLLMASQIT